MARDDDSIRIPLGPLRRVFGRTVLTTAVGFGGVLAALGIVLGTLMAVLFAALVWWLSDRAYDVHWLIGAPVRVIAFIFAIGALFSLIGAAFQLLVVILVTCWQTARAALGKPLD